MNNSDLYSGKRFRQAIQHFLLGRTAQGIASLILILWLVRLLIPADYGTYMVLWGMVEMMVPLCSLGILEAVRRFLPELATRGAPGALQCFVRWMTLVRFAIMVAWAMLISAFWSDIAVWMGFSTLHQDTTILAVGLIVTVIGYRFASEMLECLLEQRWSQLVHALMPLGRLAGMVVLVVADNLTLERLLWVDLIVSLICFLLAEFFLIRKLRNLSGTGDFRIGVRKVVSFSGYMAGFNLLNAISSAGALRILVARTLGIEVAGMFAFLQQLLKFIGRYLPANLLSNIIRPMLISRYVAGDVNVVKQGMALLWKSNLIVITALMAITGVAGDELILLASSGQFSDIGMTMLMMLLGLGATSQRQLLIMVMQIFPYTRQLSYFSILNVLTPLAVIVGSDWGLLGVASGIVLNVWLTSTLTLFWLNRQVGRINLDWFGFLSGLGLAILLATVGWVVKGEIGSWWVLTIMLLAYGPGLALVKPLNSLDMALLNRGLRQHARFLTFFARKK